MNEKIENLERAVGELARISADTSDASLRLSAHVMAVTTICQALLADAVSRGDAETLGRILGAGFHAGLHPEDHGPLAQHYREIMNSCVPREMKRFLR
jgi:hypothetical protein